MSCNCSASSTQRSCTEILTNRHFYQSTCWCSFLRLCCLLQGNLKIMKDASIQCKACKNHKRSMPKKSSQLYLFVAAYHGRIFRRLWGVSLFTNIFSSSFRGLLEPSAWLMNFQPPPLPRLLREPSFSTIKFQPSDGRLLLYLWHFTFFAN